MPNSNASIELVVQDRIATVFLNRPDKANAFDGAMWLALREVFERLNRMPDVHAVVLAGRGRHFSAGIDLSLVAEWIGRSQDPAQCPAALRENLRQWIIGLQEAINAIERCGKPVIASIHGCCIGGALDLAAACDLRYCADDASFSVKEIDLGIVADLGILQRLPRIVGDGIARELAFTARTFDGAEAERIGLVSACLDSHAVLEERVKQVAATLAGKHPRVMKACKETLLYARDHTVEDGLRQVAYLNAAILLSSEIAKSRSGSQ
jgi:enoyl-CoA hydratase